VVRTEKAKWSSATGWFVIFLLWKEWVMMFPTNIFLCWFDFGVIDSLGGIIVVQIFF